jgi:hypothetical protein
MEREPGRALGQMEASGPTWLFNKHKIYKMACISILLHMKIKLHTKSPKPGLKASL